MKDKIPTIMICITSTIITVEADTEATFTEAEEISGEEGTLEEIMVSITIRTETIF